MPGSFRAGVAAAVMLAGMTSAGAADAAIITYDFRAPGVASGGGAAGNERVFVADGLTVRTTAGTRRGGLVSAYLGQSAAGLGVSSIGESGLLDGDAIDNIGGEDFVSFAFERMVRPISVVLNVLDGGDIAYSFDPEDATLQQQDAPDGTDTLTLALLHAQRSSIFRLFAQAGGAPNAFTIQSLTVAAPVPAALPLLATALAGLGLVAHRGRRRRSH